MGGAGAVSAGGKGGVFGPRGLLKKNPFKKRRQEMYLASILWLAVEVEGGTGNLNMTQVNKNQCMRTGTDENGPCWLSAGRETIATH